MPYQEFHSEEKPFVHFKLLTFNTLWLGRDRNGVEYVADHIRHVDPDLVALQVVQQTVINI